MPQFNVNDCVIYHQPEVSTHPAREARAVQPAERGELYYYVVDHFWRVVRVHADGSIEAVGRSGRVHRFDGSDPSVEKPGWWRRWMLRRYFPGV